jgi:GMP synthase-like glutamine amidotransferase
VAPQVLFVRNDPVAPEALLGEVFTEFGFEVATFDVVAADRVDAPAHEVDFPDPTRYDAVVPLGARWAVYDERLARTWVAGEAGMIRAAVDAGVGVLGVCFGGQLLAAALGGTVAPSPRPEIGWHDVHTTDPAVVPGGPWFQWHFDRFTLPPGARALAVNDNAIQAFGYRSALALQFHPELDRGLLERWLADDGDADVARLGLTAEGLRLRSGAELDGAARRLRDLVRGFLGMLGQDRLHQPDRLR